MTSLTTIGAEHGRARGRWQAPGPDHPERRALPDHLLPSAAALFDDLPAPLPGLVVDGAAARLRTATATLAPGIERTVDGFAIRAAATCPASAGLDPDVPFAWSPATAARTLGLRAVAHHLRGEQPPQPASPAHGLPIEGAVAAVVDELMDSGGERTPGPWLAGLPAPARAVAVAQARRWAEQAVAWLPLRLVGSRALRFLGDDWWRSQARPAARRPPSALPGARAGTLVVHGRRDLTLDLAERRVAVTVAGGLASGPGLVDADALTALAALLCDPKGRLVRVVRVHPASGQVVAVNVTAELVERAVAVVLATAAVLAQAHPEPTPGPGCTWCPRRSSCAAGTTWLERPDRRSMGLPLLACGVETRGPPAMT